MVHFCFGEVSMRGTLTPTRLAIAALILSSWLPARAADLEPPYTKAPPPQVSWNGAYAGVNVGGAFAMESGTTSIGTYSTNPSGVFGGVQAGYNLLAGPNWLVGIEGEFDVTSAEGNVIVANPTAAGTITGTQRWYGTLDGRLGLVQGPLLYYVKGGGAWLDASYLVTNGVTSGPPASSIRTGWTVGAGAEYLFPSGWSAKLEYDFLDFGSGGFPTGLPVVSVADQIHEVKIGVNLHFSP
jgi:opacity protein-like surface antigen